MPDCIVSDGKALTSGAQIHGALPPGAQIHGAPSSEALRIVVVGMPLSGKTSVYRRLLNENVDGRGFVYELDAEIEKDAGKSIPEIFAEEGEAGFRVREREVLLRFLMPRETAGEVDSYALKTDISGCRSGNGIPKERAVYKEGIPTAFADRGNELKERTLIVFAGGGAVQSPETRAVLKQYGGIVYLRTSLSTLLLRLNEAETKKRPLFQMDCPIKTLKRLYEIRTKLYEELATYIIDTDGRSITEVSDELMKIVGIGGKYEGNYSGSERTQLPDSGGEYNKGNRGTQISGCRGNTCRQCRCGGESFIDGKEQGFFCVQEDRRG